MEIDPHVECDRTPARGVQTADQDADRSTKCRNRRHVVLGAVASGQITMRKVDGWRSLADKPSDQVFDLAA
jgi:hypothetical protein